jgi:Peptidase family M28
MIPISVSRIPQRRDAQRSFLLWGAGVLLSISLSACSRHDVGAGITESRAAGRDGNAHDDGTLPASAESNAESPAAAKKSPPKPDARRAKGYLEQICKIGQRVSGSKGMATQQKILIDHFTKFGAKVTKQLFDAPHPKTGHPVRFTNLIISWHPKAKQRVLLACHYDTRPFPDQDRRNPRGKFVGANDGASGAALFMEMAHHMQDLKPTYGVDFVFFDGEELVYGANAPIKQYFIGSKHFAQQYVKDPPKHKYVWGVVVDMVAGRRLQLFVEKNSLLLAPKLTRSIWGTARKLGVREFIPRERHEVQDDHIPLNLIALIPTCDLIDFDYPYWHTTQDVASKCSGASLAKVARVLLAWLEEVPRPGKDRLRN